MSAIQLKRAFTFNGSAVEAINKISKLAGDSALKLGEQMAVRYLEAQSSLNGEGRYRYMVVICTKEGTVKEPASLTILPSFDNLSDFANYIAKFSGGGSGEGATSASNLIYVFESADLNISGSTQEEFNGKIIDLLEVLNSRLTWKYL